MGLQSPGSLNCGNFKSHLGVLGQNVIWVLAPWPAIENTIRGKVIASPSLGRDESYEFVFVRDSFVHRKCSNYTLINLLFSLCKFV
jgi:hypothetical protein